MEKINDKMLKAAQELYYLGDMLSAWGGCKLAVVTRCKCSWEVLPTTTASHQPQSAGSDRRLYLYSLSPTSSIYINVGGRTREDAPSGKPK